MPSHPRAALALIAVGLLAAVAVAVELWHEANLALYQQVAVTLGA